MVNALNKANVAAHAEEARQQGLAEAPEFEKVNWTKDPSIRKLYINCALGLLIGSATTGYDGLVDRGISDRVLFGY
jgi:surface antigen